MTGGVQDGVRVADFLLGRRPCFWKVQGRCAVWWRPVEHRDHGVWDFARVAACLRGGRHRTWMQLHGARHGRRQGVRKEDAGRGAEKRALHSVGHAAEDHCGRTRAAAGRAVGDDDRPAQQHAEGGQSIRDRPCRERVPGDAVDPAAGEHAGDPRSRGRPAAGKRKGRHDQGGGEEHAVQDVAAARAAHGRRRAHAANVAEAAGASRRKGRGTLPRDDLRRPVGVVRQRRD